MQRDLRLDSLRGLMLVEITFVHTNSATSALVNECFGRVSIAAAFVFLSGLVAGAVYGRVAEKGAGAVVARSLRRALYIHAYHIAAFLALLAVILVHPNANGYFRLIPEGSVVSLWNIVIRYGLLLYQPGYFEILPLYTVFVIFMPFALIAFRRGFAPLVLALSLALWGLAQFGWGGDRSFGGSYFNPLAWQLLFFTGLFFR